MEVKRFKLRCDSSNPQHMRFTLFDHTGANCGSITIRTEDAVAFHSKYNWNGDIDWNAQPLPNTFLEKHQWSDFNGPATTTVARNELMREISHPPNAMPEELQRAHYIMQIVKLRELNAELLVALEKIAAFAPGRSAACEIIAKTAREAIAKAEALK
jgi:hypothetical protein